jgi:hypothetical protein
MAETMDKSEKQRRRKLAIQKLATLFGKDPSTLESESDSSSDVDEGCNNNCFHDDVALRKKMLSVARSLPLALEVTKELDETYWTELVSKSADVESTLLAVDIKESRLTGFASGVTEETELLNEVVFLFSCVNLYFFFKKTIKMSFITLSLSRFHLSIYLSIYIYIQLFPYT